MSGNVRFIQHLLILMCVLSCLMAIFTPFQRIFTVMFTWDYLVLQPGYITDSQVMTILARLVKAILRFAVTPAIVILSVLLIYSEWYDEENNP